MDDNHILKELMSTFLDELQDHLQVLNRELLPLEAMLDVNTDRRAEASASGPGPDNAAEDIGKERLRIILRSLHSTKGAAHAVNQELIREVAHAMEDLLEPGKASLQSLDNDVFRLSFETIDALSEAVLRLRADESLENSPLAAILPRLRKAYAPADVPAPAAPAIQVAKTAMIFDGPPAIPSTSETCGISNVHVSPNVAAATPPPTPAPPSAMMRVTAETMDALYSSSGEMLAARRRLDLRIHEFNALRDAVNHFRGDWRRMEKTLAKLIRRSGDPAALAGKNQRIRVSAYSANAGMVVNEDTDTAARMQRERALSSLEHTNDFLRRMEKDLDRLVTGLTADSRTLSQAATMVDDQVRQARMLPFSDACSGLERIVRDIMRATGRQATVSIRGGDVFMDRSILEMLKDPLNHLVRNAADHGIETPDVRQAAGKPSAGHIRIGARLQGASLLITVADDGRGLDLEALRSLARQRGLPVPEDPRELARLVFLPGVSTAKSVTPVSGRGVGLDVVKNQVEAMRGSIALGFLPGRGSRFVIRAPLTLTSLRALLVRARGQIFAVNSGNVRELIRVHPENLHRMEGRQVLRLRDAPVPIVALSQLLGPSRQTPLPDLPDPDRDRENLGIKGTCQYRPAIVFSFGGTNAALIVDELIAEQEVIVKGLGPLVRRHPLVGGGAILPNGAVAFILNPAHLVSLAIHADSPPVGRPDPTPNETVPSADAVQTQPHPQPQPRQQAQSQAQTPVKTPARPRILVVDDSITTRALEKSILETAGYDVITAADGETGWRMLQHHGADLVISDVEMPALDGLRFTERIRASARFQKTPVVLVSFRGDDQDKTLGFEAGANAYIVKNALNQADLLQTIAQLL